MGICRDLVPIMLNNCGAGETSEEKYEEWREEKKKNHDWVPDKNEDPHEYEREKRNNFPDMCCGIGNVDELADYCGDQEIVTKYQEICPEGCTRFEPYILYK